MQLVLKLVNRFSPQTKKSKKVAKKIDKIFYNPFQALRLIRCESLVNYDDHLLCQFRLNVDPKHGEQLVRGICRMPYSLGSKKKLAILTSDISLQQKCQENGADIILNEQLIEGIKNGDKIEFDSLLTTAECVPQLKSVARILGPLGLMPNIKLGTLVSPDQLAQLVIDSKKGVVTFRVNNDGIINSPLGLLKANDFQLMSNFKAMIDLLVQKKPEKVKNKYFLTVYLKSTLGQPYYIKTDFIDPRNKNCIINDL